MGQNREQLNKLLEFIDELAKDKDNAWFVEELRHRYGQNICFLAMSKDVASIREALQIRADNSLNYGYVNNKILRNQLLIDNLRMENYALDLKTLDETERFYNFCVNAFYQVENLLNFYYFVIYPDVSKLLTYLETITASLKHPFTRTASMKTIADIPIERKIYAFCNDFFPFSSSATDFTFKTLSGLRMVRNEGFHRCSVIKSNPQEKLYDFFLWQDFNTIRTLLKKLSSKVEELLKTKQSSVEIVSCLGSAIVVKYDSGVTECINWCTKDFKEGDRVTVEKDLKNKKVRVWKVNAE